MKLNLTVDDCIYYPVLLLWLLICYTYKWIKLDWKVLRDTCLELKSRQADWEAKLLIDQLL